MTDKEFIDDLTARCIAAALCNHDADLMPVSSTERVRLFTLAGFTMLAARIDHAKGTMNRFSLIAIIRDIRKQ